MNINTANNSFMSNLSSLYNNNSSATISNITLNKLSHDCFKRKASAIKADNLSFGCDSFDYRNSVSYKKNLALEDLKLADTEEDVIKVLSQGIVGPNTLNDDGVPPLHYTIFKKTTEPLKELIKAGADVNAISKNNGETALILASRYGNIEAVLELIDAKADLNIKDKNGKSALSHAVSWAYRDEPELQKILISSGADKSDYKIEYEPDETGELQLMLS